MLGSPGRVADDKDGPERVGRGGGDWTGSPWLSGA